MESIIHASKTELARNTRKIIRAAQQGQTVVIKHHGEEEVAIVDIIDHRLLKAFAQFHHDHPEISEDDWLTDEAVAAKQTLQAKYNLILAHYLANSISMGRAAELFKIPWIDLRTRFNRLNIPMHTLSIEDIKSDIATLEAMLSD